MGTVTMIEESQLELPNVDAEPGVSNAQLARLPRSRRVFVNRSLRMDHIDWVGFDMDYTLAIYRQEQIDALSIAATVKKLVERGYPPYLAEARYETGFAMRGLFIDKKYGNVLKMDRYKYVGRAWHGMRELSRDERHALYHTRRCKVAAPRFHWIDTLYALPEAALYAGAIDVLERYGANFDPVSLFDDIRESIDEAHRDGAIVDVIATNLERFVERDDSLGPTLHKLRSAGKKLFLLTNSRWAYTDNMMQWLLHGALPEYPSWRNYFDAVVCASAKPVFFTEKRPLMERLVEVPGEPTRVAYTVEKDRVYEGGNLRDFERMIDAQGDRVLYIGDHIFGDILRSKKDSSWRTVMIIQEMDHELDAIDRTRDAMAQLDAFARRWSRLEDELRFYQSRLRGLARGAASKAPLSALDGEEIGVLRKTIDTLKASRKSLNDQWRALERQTDAVFHPCWGSLFKQAVELSSFGDQVEEYACLYTSRVSNLMAYSPSQYFRSPRDLMPHELQ